MNGVSPVLASPVDVRSPMGPAGSIAPSLLPHVEAPPLPQLQDAMAQLYLVLSQLREAQATHGKMQIDGAKTERDIAARKEKEALERAKKAAEEGGFFDWIAKDLGLAGAVGLVTFNYPLIVADIFAHKLGLFDSVDEKVDFVDVAAVATGRWEVVAADVLLRKTDLAPHEVQEVFEKSGIPKDAPGVSKEDVDPIAKEAIMANLLIMSTAASVLTFGTTAALVVALLGMAISMGGSVIAKEKALDGVLGEGSSKWIGLGMQIYGTLASSMSGLAGGASTISNGARAAALATATVAAMRGTDQVVTAVNERERDEANIDAAGARHRLGRLERLIEQITDAIKEVYDSHRKAAETLQGAIDTANKGDLVLSQAIKG